MMLFFSDFKKLLALALPAVQAAIAKGRPLIAGFGTRAEFKPVAKAGA